MTVWFCQETYASTSAASCVDCEAGKYLSSTGSNSSSDCVLCASGTYSPNTGAVSEFKCQGCPAGTYSIAKGLQKATQCELCPRNTYSSAIGASEAATCIACNPGKVAPAGNVVKENCVPGVSDVSSRKTVDVTMAVSLPLREHQFTSAHRLNFRAALAEAAQVKVEDVIIEKIDSISDGGARRRILAASIRIQTRVSTDRQSAVILVENAPSYLVKINSELIKRGIPSVTMLEKPSLASTADEDESSTYSTESQVNQEAYSRADGASSRPHKISSIFIYWAGGAMVAVSLVWVAARLRRSMRSKTCIHPLQPDMKAVMPPGCPAAAMISKCDKMMVIPAHKRHDGGETQLSTGWRTPAEKDELDND